MGGQANWGKAYYLCKSGAERFIEAPAYVQNLKISDCSDIFTAEKP